MAELLSNHAHFITKSFWTMGRRLDSCFGCKYCRELDGQTKGFDIQTCPTEISPLLSNIPVAINIFYGDPFLQADHTIRLLHKLEQAGHEGPVIIITKGDLASFLLRMQGETTLNLDIHFAFSTFGRNHELDGGSVEQLESNLSLARKAGIRNFSIEFRPIISGINDDEVTLNRVFELAHRFNAPIGYSGLQGKPETVANWDKESIQQLKPYPGTSLGFKKHVSQEVDEFMRLGQRRWGVPTFRKTSCLISFSHRLVRDYNAHYYRPHEMDCSRCWMNDRCMSFKAAHAKIDTDMPFKLPFAHKIVFKDTHQCPWLHKGCEFPTQDCSNLSGYFIDAGRTVTTSDVRVIKWLTGMTVCSDFVESPYLSDFWVIGT